jgi:DNA-binding transcriptional ArsR family regulator
MMGCDLDHDDLASILNSSIYGILCMDLSLKVIFVNPKAEEILKSKKEEIIGVKNPLHLEEGKIFARLGSLTKNNNKLFLSNVKSKQTSELMIDGDISGIYDSNGKLTGLCCYISKTLSADKEGNGAKKRTFDSIRILILSTLYEKRKTINQIAKDIGVNWKTVEHHLTYLAGKQLIHEVLSSEYVRIFEITNKGREYMKSESEKYQQSINDNTEHIEPAASIEEKDSYDSELLREVRE